MDVSVSNPIACTPAFNTYSRGTAWQSGIDSMQCQATTDDHFLSASSGLSLEVRPWWPWHFCEEGGARQLHCGASVPEGKAFERKE